MNLNLPTMASSTHSHTSYSTADIVGIGIGSCLTTGLSGPRGPVGYNSLEERDAANRAAQFAFINVNKPKGNPMPARRVVQVFIADPNENISLDDCLLFKGIEKVTDATDQELFFELDIKTLLRPALAYLQPPASVLHSVARLPGVIQHPVRSRRHGALKRFGAAAFIVAAAAIPSHLLERLRVVGRIRADEFVGAATFAATARQVVILDCIGDRADGADPIRVISPPLVRAPDRSFSKLALA
jgi:hypothetical protein